MWWHVSRYPLLQMWLDEVHSGTPSSLPPLCETQDVGYQKA